MQPDSLDIEVFDCLFLIIKAVLLLEKSFL